MKFPRNSTPGIVALVLLAMLLIGLKLTGHIDWSWWWVLAPIWLPPALFIGFFAGGLGIVLVIDAFRRLRRRLKR